MPGPPPPIARNTCRLWVELSSLLVDQKVCERSGHVLCAVVFLWNYGGWALAGVTWICGVCMMGRMLRLR